MSFSTFTFYIKLHEKIMERETMGRDEAKCILGACCDAPNTIKAIQGKQENTIKITKIKITQ